MSDLPITERHIYPVFSQTTVRYCDLDPNGHVNNGAFSAYFEDGRVRLRTTHLSAVGGAMLSGFAIARICIDYRAPLSFPASVDIGSSIVRIGRSSYTLAQAVFEGERCVARAEVVTVRFDPHTHRSIPIEDGLRAVLETLAPRTE